MQNLSLILLLFSLSNVFLFFNKINLLLIVLFFIWYLTVVGIGVSLVLHRDLSHYSIKTNSLFKNIILTIFTFTTSISPCSWVVVHRTHHKYSDKEFDPHPATIKGIYNNIVGNIQVPKKDGVFFSKHLLENSYIKFLHKNKNTITIVFLIILLFIGPAALLLWSLVFLGYKIQSILNAYLAHKFGYKNFKLDNKSTNEPITTIISFGEGLHNNHHANPRCVNFSYKKYEFDIGYALFCFFKKIGLMKDA